MVEVQQSPTQSPDPQQNNLVILKELLVDSIVQTGMSNKLKKNSKMIQRRLKTILKKFLNGQRKPLMINLPK